MDTEISGAAGTEHIINTMVLIEVDLSKNGLPIVMELSVKFQRGTGQDMERLYRAMILLDIRQILGRNSLQILIDRHN